LSQEKHGPQPIAQAIRQFLAQGGLRRPPADERVFRAWAEAAGPDWAARARPVSLRGGQLTVEVAASVHLAELKGFHGESIRTRANALLDGRSIHRVVFKLKS
jgi:hypothetical protein